MNIKDYKRVMDRFEADEKCKEEVFDMLKRENKIKLNKDYTEDVSGVEVRHGSNITKYIGIAAAFALVAGGIGTTSVLLHNSRNGSSQLAEVIEDESEETTETSEQYDYYAIAQELTDSYLECVNIVLNGDISYDTEDYISFYVYDTFKEFEDERRFFKVTDKRFGSCQDVYEYYRGIAGPDLPENFMDARNVDDQVMLKLWLGGDVSEFENGSRVNINSEDMSSVDVSAQSVNSGVYIDYNGQLYVADVVTHPYKYSVLDIKSVYTNEPELVETGAESFAALRTINNIHYGDDGEISSEINNKKLFTFALINGEWKIDSVISQ